MLNREELGKLMSFVGRGRGSGETQVPHLDPGESEAVTDLLSLLSLPELREENNPDLPFHIAARYRGNVCGDALQTVGMENLHYARESAFLAEWMGRLTGKPQIHCFDRTLMAEFDSSSEGLLQLRITRDSAKNSLSLTHVGPSKKSIPIEIWEKGILIRRTDGNALGAGIPVAIQDGTAVGVRCGLSDSGVEILIAEGEFGPDEWKALLACLCLQGRFRKALEILKDQTSEESVDSIWLPRFRAFLGGVAAVTKADGYVLRPLPVVRSLDTPVELAPFLEENSPQEYQDAWISGWNHLSQRDFGLASKSFSSFQGLGQSEWSLPLEGRLVHHLESLSSVKIPLKEEVELSARFWEEVFHDLSLASCR